MGSRAEAAAGVVTIMHRRSPAGLTLVELLVVVAILAALVALLMPAVQAARESARTLQCANNLKQIGLAFQSHEASLRAYPSGGRTIGNWPRTFIGTSPALYESQNWGWPYQILPYIEQRPLWENPNDTIVFGTTVANYFCPTRRPPTALRSYAGLFRAMIDYAGNGGTSMVDGNGWGLLGAGSDGVICGMGYGVRTPDHVRDGLSMTLLAGEKQMNIALCTREIEADDDVGFVGGMQDDNVRWGTTGTPWGNLTPSADVAMPKYSLSTLRPFIWRFGSSHAAGAMFVACDGSTRVISFTVEPQAFRRLCAIRDGEVIDASGL